MSWPGGNFPTGDLRGQGGGDRDTYKLPNEGLEQAKFAARADAEHGRKPGLLTRLTARVRGLLGRAG